MGESAATESYLYYKGVRAAGVHNREGPQREESIYYPTFFDTSRQDIRNTIEQVLMRASRAKHAAEEQQRAKVEAYHIAREANEKADRAATAKAREEALNALFGPDEGETTQKTPPKPLKIWPFTHLKL